jgi:hypothetical protein
MISGSISTLNLLTALMTAQSGYWGRVVESAVGAHLAVKRDKVK